MKTILTSAVLGLALMGTHIALAQDAPTPVDFGPKENLSIAANGAVHSFNVEVADTPTERARGLMFRDILPNEEGMLFKFPQQEVASIWMKNTSVFLDILFVRADGTILKIEHSAKPYSLRSVTSEAPVAAVLELAGGQALERGIKPGDRVNHPFFDGPR